MNLMTLAILAGLLAADGDEPQSKPPPATAQAQDPDRPVISAADLKALRDTNIFAPKNVKRTPPRTPPAGLRSAPPAPYKPKAPIVTAIFLDAASREHQVIVEDRNDSAHRYFKEPKFMKAGDEWAGVKLESVTQDVAVFSKGGASKEVHIGEGLPEVEVKPPSSTEGSDEGAFEDGETPAPADAGASGSKGRKTSAEPRTQTSEEQNRVLEEMRRKNKKKNRPGTPEE